MKLGVRHPGKKAKKRRAERRERSGVLVENEAGSRRRKKREETRERIGGFVLRDKRGLLRPLLHDKWKRGPQSKNHRVLALVY